jgi:hypothetical protein
MVIDIIDSGRLAVRFAARMPAPVGLWELSGEPAGVSAGVPPVGLQGVLSVVGIVGYRH